MTSYRALLSLRLKTDNDSAVVQDFRRGGVIVAHNVGLAGRMLLRFKTDFQDTLRSFLGDNPLISQPDEYLRDWQNEPVVVGLSGIGSAQRYTLMLSFGETLFACRHVTAQELSTEYNVLFLEKRNDCE